MRLARSVVAVRIAHRGGAAEARPRDELALPPDLPDTTDPYAAAALVDACLAIFNANEFVYID